MSAPPADWPAVWPDILTADEAARFLRLTDGRSEAAAQAALRRLTERHGLRACRIGKDNRYTLAEVRAFAARMTEDAS